MTNKLLQSHIALFDLFPHPVTFVQDNLMIYCNAAAKELFPEAVGGKKQIGLICPILETMFHTSSDPNHPTVLSGCVIGEQHYNVSISTINDIRIYVFNPDPDFSNNFSSALLPAIAAVMRNPASTLLYASNLLSPLIYELDNPKAIQYLSIMNQCYYKLLRMINNITDSENLTKPGNLSLAPENMDVAGFCRQLAHTITPLAAVAGIQFHFESQLQSRIIAADPQKLERLLLNLISNALKFTPSGGVVILRLSASKDNVFLTVSDNGSGISPDLLPSIFTRYLHPNLNDTAPIGLGLGLPLVRQIAQQHGGTVVLESREGKGTTVTVSLPNRQVDSNMLRAPACPYDYAGGFSHVMVELATALPFIAFSPLDLE